MEKKVSCKECGKRFNRDDLDFWEICEECNYQDFNPEEECDSMDRGGR